MATGVAPERGVASERSSGLTRTSSVTFDWLMTGLSLLFLLGLFIDGWAHNHLERLETFFTPWHALFYGSYLLLALVFAGYVYAGVRTAGSWRRAIPAGYEWSAIGLALFAVSGFGDMLWHLAFGIEVDTEALLSPTHLGLATGMALLFAGPVRAAIVRGAPESAAALWPAVLSLTIMLTGLTFMTQFAPALVDWGVGARPSSGDLMELRLDRAVVSQLWITAVMIGVILFAVRQWGARLPVGSLTVMIGLNAVLMSTQSGRDYYFAMLPAAIAAGVVADGLLLWLRPSAQRIAQFRWFAFLVPFVYWSAHYLDDLVRGEHIWWKIHVWAGIPVITGLIGLLLSFFAVTAKQPEDIAASTSG